MALEGKGKQVASEPTRSTSTRASGTPRGSKRRRGPRDGAEPSSPAATAKRRRRAGVPKSVDGDPCISVEEEDEENQEVEPEDHPDDDCVLGEARARQEQPLPPGVPRVKQLAWLPMALLENGSKQLIPSVPFYRQVMQISRSFSREMRWTPEALLELQFEAERYLAEVFVVVDQLARAVMVQPIPWYDNNTRLTLRQEEAVFALSCGTSGIPVYVLTIVKWNVRKHLTLPKQYWQHFLAPRLGSKKGQIKIFCGNNLTGSKVGFLTEKNYLTLSKGWTNFVKTNCIKEGNIYALTFEEDEEGGLLSARMHLLNGVLDSEEDDQGSQESREGTLSLGQRAADTRAASMQIPYWDFNRLVLEITKCFSGGYRWDRDALISLHQAAVHHLVSLYELVNHSVISALAPYISDNTNLTPEEEQAAIILWCGCASGIRAYIWTVKGSYKNHLWFEKKFSEQYLSRYLGSSGWKTKIFAGDNLTPVEGKLQKHKQRATAVVYGGWSRFVRTHGIKAGDVCAFTFEEEGDSLSVRVHVLRPAPTG